MDLISDVRASLRGFRRRPFHPLVAVTILTLGLAATVAVFTYFNSFSQAFPGANPSGLVRVFGVADDDPYQNVSYLDFADYASAASAGFTGVTAAQPFYAASVRLEATTEVAFLTAVAGNFFGVLDVPMTLGRAITPADDRPGADAVAVLSHRWWQRSFGGRPDVLGTTVYLNYRPFTVIGVAAPEFVGVTASFRPDVWIPIAPFRDRYVSWAAQAENRDRPLVQVFARLREGVDRTQAESELRTLAAGLDATYPRRAGSRAIRIAAATWIDPRTRAGELPTLRIMLLAAGGLLLLVCANVANLLLSIATGRMQEFAMRASLGASPGRLFRMVLVENLILSGGAGAAALALAIPLSSRLGSYFARPSVWGANVSREPAIDLRIVGFAIAVAIATGLVAGLLPALRASGRRVLSALKSGGAASGAGPRTIAGRRVPGIHDLLVTSQVGLAVVLLVVAGLVLRTLATARAVDSGFAHEQLLASYISTSSTGVQPEERDRYFRDLAQSLQGEPWVRAATIADNAPLSPLRSARYRLPGQDEPAPAITTSVVPGFFETIGLPLLDGRRFTTGDTLGAPDVAIVNEAVVRRFFAGEQPLGRRLWMTSAGDAPDRGFEVVGVVRDAKAQDFLADPEPVVYLSYPQQTYASGSALVVATTIDPAAAVAELHRWLRRYEPHLAIVNVLPYTEVVRGFLYVQRMNAELFATLAFLGLSLAAVGIFSVVSLAVGRRRREIGIRMAIGARQADIGRLIVGRAMTPVLAGLALGLAGALALTGVVRSLLYGIEPTDPIAVAAGTAVLIAAALLAAYVPARRAGRVDPMIALRSE